jgi:hypothetical protein
VAINPIIRDDRWSLKELEVERGAIHTSSYAQAHDPLTADARLRICTSFQKIQSYKASVWCHSWRKTYSRVSQEQSCRKWHDTCHGVVKCEAIIEVY